MHYVIIGGSIAGMSAAKAIRDNDAEAGITIVSEEKTGAYYRPMIPLLIEKEDIDITFAEDPVIKYNLKTVHDKATGIDQNAKEVILSSGKRLNFDRLLIATGGSPVIPDIPGLGGKGAFTLRNYRDALEIREYSAGKKEAVVLGAGLIGIKAATALKHLGLNVTIIEKLEWILHERLDERGSLIVSNVIKDADVNILTGKTVMEVIRKNDVLDSIKLSTGKTIAADIIIVATGAKPNMDFLEGAGIKTGRGILINENLQTGAAGVYAAGDAVEYKDIVSNAPCVSALWTNAEEMGRLAGKNMSGANLKYAGFLSVMNSTGIFGLPFISIGIIDPEEKDFETTVEEDAAGSYRKLVWRDDVLVGAIFINNIEGAGIYTNLIKNSIPLGRLKKEALKGNLGYIHFIKMLTPQKLYSFSNRAL